MGVELDMYLITPSLTLDRINLAAGLEATWLLPFSRS